MFKPFHKFFHICHAYRHGCDEGRLTTHCLFGLRDKYVKTGILCLSFLLGLLLAVKARSGGRKRGGILCLPFLLFWTGVVAGCQSKFWSEKRGGGHRLVSYFLVKMDVFRIVTKSHIEGHQMTIPELFEGLNAPHSGDL